MNDNDVRILLARLQIVGRVSVLTPQLPLVMGLAMELELAICSMDRPQQPNAGLGDLNNNFV